MRVLRRVLVISAVIAVCSVAHVQAQFKPMAWEAGIGMGYNFGMTDQKDDATRFMGRAFVRRGLLDFLQIEAGGFASGIAG
ncbi:MAG TPA: hypothetical protein VK470_11525, partial [Bacteroidota bacterium]|nr:hypothetical protein [Bacteroidota bacterium]